MRNERGDRAHFQLSYLNGFQIIPLKMSVVASQSSQSWDLGTVVGVEAHSTAHLELSKMNGLLMYGMSLRFTLVNRGCDY